MWVSKKRFDKIEEDAAKAMARCDAFTNQVTALTHKITCCDNRIDDLYGRIRKVSERTMVGQFRVSGQAVGGYSVNDVVSAILEELGFSIDLFPGKLFVRKVGADGDPEGE